MYSFFWKIFVFLSFFLTLPNVNSQWLPDAYVNDFRVNDDVTSRTQAQSKIGVDSAGNFVVAWNDRRNFPDDQQNQVHCQIFDKSSNRIGSNFRIGQDTTYIVDIVALDNGSFVVVWLNLIYSIDRYEICYQKFNRIGLPLTPILRVVDTNYSIGAQTFGGGAIEADLVGNFVICWSRAPNIVIPSKVFFQRFDSSGNRLGIVDTVNELNTLARYPGIAVNSNGSYVICWQDNRFNTSSNKFDIFLQRYAVNGIKLGNNVKVNDDIDTTNDQLYSSISSDGNGKFVICWIDERIPSSTKIYYQLYDNSGIPIGPNKLASSTSSGFAISPFPVSAMRRDGYFFVGWSDYDRFLGRRFDNLGNPYGISFNNPYVVPSTPLNHACNDIRVWEDRVYAIWADNRLGNADVFCNVRGFQNPDTIVGIKNQSLIQDYVLYEPYPNPFNAATNIEFEIPEHSYVELKVYDMTGKEIKVIFSGYLQKGIYMKSFNATAYSSGVYFLTLKINNSEIYIKKIMFIK